MSKPTIVESNLPFRPGVKQCPWEMTISGSIHPQDGEELLLEAQPLLHGDEAWYDARLTGVSGGRCVVCGRVHIVPICVPLLVSPC